MFHAAIFAIATLVRVIDGDTIDVRDESGHLVRVRLSGIDAPEKDQAYGREARESLRQLLDRGPLVVEEKTSDRYGRVVAKVMVSGRDAGLEQVLRGFAWADPLYAREEQLARAFHRGLWSERDPTPPWRFRRLRSPPENLSH